MRFIIPTVVPFQFKKSESPEKALRRVCRERIGAARKRLRQDDQSAGIHDARREIKKLRALFRLAREESGRGAYRKSVKSLRKAARHLAAPRDARVILKAFEKLTGNDAPQFPEIEQALRRHYRRAARRFQKKDFISAADKILRKVNRRAGHLKTGASGWAAIGPGLKSCYARGRKACALARLKPLPENLHHWRKHVKNLSYYSQLLHPAWPPEMRAMTDDWELLGAKLGEDHDLFLLAQFVGARFGGNANETKVLRQLIETRQRELRVAALNLGSRFYSEPPKAFCRRLENYWKVWRGE